MNHLADVYYLESIEQVRALTHRLRIRILEALAQQPMTAKQLAVLLGEPPAKVHYHVRELEGAGLARLVATHEKGGILEKYYRSIAQNFSIPETLLSSAPPSQMAIEMDRMLKALSSGFRRVLASGSQQSGSGASLNVSTIWLSESEYHDLASRLQSVLDGYRGRQVTGRRREYTAAIVLYDTSTAPESSEHSVTKPRPREGTS